MYLKVEKNNFIRPNWEIFGKNITTTRNGHNYLEDY